MTLDRYITICGYLFNGLLFMLIALFVIAFGFELVIAIANAASLTRCAIIAHKVNKNPLSLSLSFWANYFWGNVWGMLSGKPEEISSIEFTWRGIGNYTIHGVKDGHNDT